VSPAADHPPADKALLRELTRQNRDADLQTVLDLFEVKTGRRMPVADALRVLREAAVVTPALRVPAPWS
jgi:hypothetical protein